MKHRPGLENKLALLLLGLAMCLGSGRLHAQGNQNPDYIVWVEADRESCSTGEQVTVRVLMEIRPGAVPVTGWQLGVCHDPQFFRLEKVDPGAATRGVCNGQDAASVTIRQHTAATAAVAGFTEEGVLPAPGATCSLPPGCPHELAVATYTCLVSQNRVAGAICLCDTLGEPPVVVSVNLANDRTVIPVRACERRECGGGQPGEPETCDCTGRSFWLAFPGNFEPDPPLPKDLRLLIASETGASGQVEVLDIGFSQPFNVAPNAVTEVVIPHDAELGLASDVIEQKGIRVVANNPIQVHGVNQVPFTVDGFLGLPTRLLGTEYLVLGYKNVHDDADILNGSQFAIVGTEDGTKVIITPTEDTDGHPAGVAYSIELNRGESYQLSNRERAAGTFPDLSGTVITSTRPVAVFGGHFCASIPDAGTFFCNYNVEQLPPTKLWGAQFLAVPLETRSGDRFRILAQSNGTSIQINGLGVGVINRGEVLETPPIVVPVRITGSQAILVAQHAQSSKADNVDEADPSMMLVPPVNQYRDRYLLRTPSTGFDSLNFVNVIAPGGAVGAILLDGVPIPAAAFSPPIGGSGFRGAQVSISKGIHRLTGPSPFGVMAYGFDDQDAYSFPACVAFDDRRPGQEQVEVRRAIEDNPCDDRPAIVTLTAIGGQGAVTVTERLPPCATIPDTGGGEVADGTIRFTIPGNGSVSYAVDISECCQENENRTGVDITGEVETGACPGAVGGGSRVQCCDACDTHCTGLDVVQVDEPGGNVRASAAAVDDSGDAILYTFRATLGAMTITIGPQPGPTALFDLAPGTWSISVVVSDGSDCRPPAMDAECKTTITIVGLPPFKRGDANNDGDNDISDGVFSLIFLFLGGPRPVCFAAADINGDGMVDISDPIFLLNFLFLGGPVPPGPDCQISTDLEDLALGCNEANCP